MKFICIIPLFPKQYMIHGKKQLKIPIKHRITYHKIKAGVATLKIGAANIFHFIRAICCFINLEYAQAQFLVRHNYGYFFPFVFSCSFNFLDEWMVGETIFHFF